MMVQRRMAAVIAICASMTFLSGQSSGQERAGRLLSLGSDTASLRPLTADCIERAARVFGFEPVTLWAVLKVEGGRLGECLGNGNPARSWDCGPFQINTQHIPRLAELLQLSEQEVLRRLRDDGSFNALVAAWLLADARRSGGIGRYHSPSRDRAASWERRLHESIKRMDPSS